LGSILRIGFRQISAIRDQVIFALGSCMETRLHFTLKEWVRGQAQMLVPYLPLLDEVKTSHDERTSIGYGSSLHSLFTTYAQEDRSNTALGAYWREEAKRTSESEHLDEDLFGSEIGGGWDIEAFITRAGIVLTLGAREEFERGVLRMLFASKEPLKPEAIVRVGTIRPGWEDFILATKEWKEKEGQARTCSARRKLFHKFEIESLPDGSEWVDRLESAWSDRNLIVHGSKPVQFSFSRFLDVHLDVFTAMNHLADECLQKANIEI
jgi:hypothetical protein